MHIGSVIQHCRILRVMFSSTKRFLTDRAIVNFFLTSVSLLSTKLNLDIPEDPDFEFNSSDLIVLEESNWLKKLKEILFVILTPLLYSSLWPFLTRSADFQVSPAWYIVGSLFPIISYLYFLYSSSQGEQRIRIKKYD